KAVMYGGKTKLKKWKPKETLHVPQKKWMQKILYLYSIHQVLPANPRVWYTRQEVIWFIQAIPPPTYFNTSLARFISGQPTSVGLPDTATLFTDHFPKERRR